MCVSVCGCMCVKERDKKMYFFILEIIALNIIR